MSIKGPLVARAARAYTSGPDLDDALRFARALATRRIGAAIGLLDARAPAGEWLGLVYRDAIDGIAREGLDAYVSIKAPALAFDTAALASLSRRATAAGIGLHLDSLGPETATATLELLAELADARTRVGCTLPGRWARSVSDAEAAMRMGVSVRVVKGQWRDGPGAPPDDRAGFEAVVDRLSGYDQPVAVASHDADLVRTAVARLRAGGTPCSVELLYGLPPTRVAAVARAEGVPLRVYVPFGGGSLPYSLGERGPRALGWFLHDLVLPRRRPRALLRT